MKKFFKLFGFFFVLLSLLGLTSCGKYKEEAGVYECVEFKMEGIDMVSIYDYYTIELKANGDVIVKSKGNGVAYEAEGTFEIDGETIEIYTEVNSATITEIYDYIDGKIIMDTELQGVSIYAVFERQE